MVCGKKPSPRAQCGFAVVLRVNHTMTAIDDVCEDGSDWLIEYFPCFYRWYLVVSDSFLMLTYFSPCHKTRPSI